MALSDSNVDETMADDWKAIQEKYAVEDETPEPAEKSESQETAPDAPEKAETRTRDATGKFVKGEEKPDEKNQPRANRSNERTGTSAATRGAGDDPGKPVLPEPAQTGAERDINRAPSSWKPTERALWEKVDPQVRAAIHRRESEMAAGAQQLMPDAQFGKGLRQVIDPYRMLIEAEGGTPEKAVGDLLKTAAIFRVGTNEQKAHAVAGIVRQFGIDMRVLLPQGQQPNGQAPPQQQFRDPRVDQFLAQQQRDREQAAQREQATLESTVNQWMNEVDAQGQPTRPYLQDVITEMSALIPQIKEANPSLTNAQALEEAYTRAIWANPEIRALLQQQAAADSSAQRQADNQTRLRDVRRAASVNVPRRASVPSAGKPGRMEDTIAETARELGLIST